MNIEGIIEIREQFRRKGIFHPSSQMVAAHFSHNTGLLHADLVELLSPHEIVTAYDGMILRIGSDR